MFYKKWIINLVQQKRGIEKIFIKVFSILSTIILSSSFYYSWIKFDFIYFGLSLFCLWVFALILFIVSDNIVKENLDNNDWSLIVNPVHYIVMQLLPFVSLVGFGGFILFIAWGLTPL